MKILGIDVYFEEQKIHSLSCEGELMLTILAGYAQEESRSVSENCKWRIRKDFEKGKPVSVKMLGYQQKEGIFYIVPDEAEIVRQIFSGYLGGMGVMAIAKRCKANGHVISKGGVFGMLRNEKYTGDMLLQKSFIADHISKRQIKNTGQLPQYYVSESHEAIISHAQFDAVQAEIARRELKHGPKKPAKPHYPFSGMIRCGKCGAGYRRKHAAAGSKYEKIVWICSTFNSLGKTECDSQQIPEDILWEKVHEIGGLAQVAEITVPDHNRLLFRLKDGSTAETEWHHRSRRESWTDEMKQQARETALKGGKTHV